MNIGVILAFATYVIWGLFPVYFHWLASVPPFQVVADRIVSSFVLLLALGFLLPGFRNAPMPRFSIRTVLAYAAAAGLISGNWIVFVWAVQHHDIIETSLGYFITPLLNVALGVLWFKETLRRVQWIAIVIAASGVFYLTWVYGQPPWVALILATSFALYGLVKKQVSLDPMRGLTLETGILLVPALAFLALDHGTAAHLTVTTRTLLIVSGVVTALPLWMFAYAAQRIPLALLGVLQYIAPILQFSVGVVLYHEPFTRTDRIGFGFIWVALVLFIGDGLVGLRRQMLSKKQAPTSADPLSPIDTP